MLPTKRAQDLPVEWSSAERGGAQHVHSFQRVRALRRGQLRTALALLGRAYLCTVSLLPPVYPNFPHRNISTTAAMGSISIASCTEQFSFQPPCDFNGQGHKTGMTGLRATDVIVMKKWKDLTFLETCIVRRKDMSHVVGLVV